ncbi:MAG: small subunit ribosomal protein S9 [Parcubacteria group bacterium Gr01-1014_19]|nr:MAG: small subunit ribosomal protein S9 [Parcubacteria group bacterium Gr01-1014_19]
MEKEKAKTNRYFTARGGRKTANAYARVFIGKGILVNNKDYKDYFKTVRNQSVAFGSLETSDMKAKIGATVTVAGGGINAQADAVRNAIARALVNMEPELRKVLKVAGFLKRDARMVERKKYGLRKARRAPQWAKR